MRPPILNDLFADVASLPGVGPKIAVGLAKVAGPRVVDLAFTPPVNVIDRSARPKLRDAPTGEIVTVLVTVDRHDPPPSRQRPYRIICSDDTGYVTLVYFHARGDYLRKILPEGEDRLVSGRIEEFGASRQIVHPDFVADPEKARELPLFEAVYPGTQGVSRSVVRRAIENAVARAPVLPEWQDATWVAKNGWGEWREALRTAHQPRRASDIGPATPALSRLAYDELLANQLALALVRRETVRTCGRAMPGDGKLTGPAIRLLPFSLTVGQQQALREIGEDMRSPRKMLRLLQGDVGAGKTIIAFLAMLRAVEHGLQAALMAPTEILARQHYDAVQNYAEALNIPTVLLTGRSQGAERRELLERVASGEAALVFGTHALFQDDVNFRDLGLVVVDEQHRFGVHQRLALSRKGAAADLLVMTATPIPRTLALTIFGEMESSELREKPAGRKPIKTLAIPDARLEEIIAALRRAIEAGEQAYWVCSLVSPSEQTPLVSAEDRYQELSSIFGDRVGLIHGRMPPAEKDDVIRRFHEREISLLVATTVIEVGVDAPNATVIVIEHAERFGLAQLHQMRGRVGRGEKESTCILLYAPPLGETATARLKILRETNDGFRIAEEDLRLRGAGDLIGTQQSGAPIFRFADLAVHGGFLDAARDDSKLALSRDPRLESERGHALRILLYLFGRDEAVRLIRSG